jgi:2-polyprenyl-6-methoxyphenol hydroxylase-like FAD-dependent oxidoreductase
MSDGSFDVIIVGAGSVGCVLASRLHASAFMAGVAHRNSTQSFAAGTLRAAMSVRVMVGL